MLIGITFLQLRFAEDANDFSIGALLSQMLLHRCQAFVDSLVIAFLSTLILRLAAVFNVVESIFISELLCTVVDRANKCVVFKYLF